VPVTIFEFGEFSLDCDRFELRRAGRTVKLERKPMELLILLAVSEGNLVTRAEIIERLWGSEVFVDTEHGINTAIRKVRQTLRDDPDQPRFVQTVMGKGYRFIGPISEAHPPPSLLHPEPAASVAIDVATAIPTPQSSASETAAPSHRPRLRSWLPIGASAVVLCCITAFTLRAHWSHERSARAATSNIESIAVLPLDNLSGDPSQNYFADGMTDELTTMLAKNSTLHVISRTSAMQYKGAHRPLREIAQALGVDGILEGSIERSGDKVHMTVHSFMRLATLTYGLKAMTGTNSDVAMMPEQAAQSIAKRLNASVAATRVARYISPEAHDAYLQGKFHLFADGGGGAYFKKAVEIQPDYAAGWAGLAQYYGSNSGGSMDPRQANQQLMLAARKAIELDDSLPEAHGALGQLSSTLSGTGLAESEKHAALFSSILNIPTRIIVSPRCLQHSTAIRRPSPNKKSPLSLIPSSVLMRWLTCINSPGSTIWPSPISSSVSPQLRATAIFL
jgi:TolB-like protein/DNA-binding winged helix-turn-helix (wHTH) protein